MQVVEVIAQLRTEYKEVEERDRINKPLEEGFDLRKSFRNLIDEF